MKKNQNVADFVFGWFLFLLPFIVILAMTADREWGIIMSVVFMVGFMYIPIGIGLVAVLILKAISKYNIIIFGGFEIKRIYYGLLFCLIVLSGIFIIHNKKKETTPYCQYVTRLLTVEELKKCN